LCKDIKESPEPANNDDLGPKHDRHCILHAGKPSEKKPHCDILPFDEKNRSTVRAAGEKRHAKPQFPKSVYFDLVVSLPQNPYENNGYHVACYQKFTAVTSTTSAPERNMAHLHSNVSVDDD
ncbi:hypothetical protein SK128_017501, partial [Halocaridina rubra]